MRCGRFSSSSCSPTGSFFGAARSPSRSAIPNTKRTVAYIPIATPGSPFSILTRVVRLIEARCAAINLDEGRAADRGALRREGGGDAPPPPGVTDVAAELAEGMPYREWHYDGRSAGPHI